MIKDRRALIEEEIAKAQQQAAAMYLDIVTHCGDEHSPEYHALKEKILNLEFDLKIVNQLILKGHQ
jgi:hypothetical protein